MTTRTVVDLSTKTVSVVPLTAEEIAADEARAAASASQVPATVTARQGRLQLHADSLLATVEAMVAAPEADAALKIEWEYSTLWERDSAWIGQLGMALGLTATDLDRMFTEAAAR